MRGVLATVRENNERGWGKDSKEAEPDAGESEWGIGMGKRV